MTISVRGRSIILSSYTSVCMLKLAVTSPPVTIFLASLLVFVCFISEIFFLNCLGHRSDRRDGDKRDEKKDHKKDDKKEGDKKDSKKEKDILSFDKIKVSKENTCGSWPLKCFCVTCFGH